MIKKFTIKNLQHALITICALMLGISSYAQKSTSVEQKTYSNQRDMTEAKIDSIMVLMSLKEKVAMCHAQSKFSTKGVARLGIPELWMSDGPHGVRAEISWDDWAYANWTNDSITAFPALTCLAASFNTQLSGEYGFSVGEEARYRKKDVLLGPGVNIYRTPLNGRNFEYLGEDPFLASTLVVPYIKGVQKNGVAACVKHFALNNQELWRDHINVEVSERALNEIYLPAFKAAVTEAQVWSVMGAYNKFKGQWCCQNEFLLNDILKNDWKFDGVVISDWSGAHNTKESALNGLDIEMGTGTDGLGTTTKSHYEQYYLASPFLEGLENGEYEESVVDDKVRRILRLMYRTTMTTNRPWGKMNTEEHHNVARNVAREGIVLLKNDNNFFPIKDDKTITIAVIGENATRPMTPGGGSSELKPEFEISPLEGLRQRYKNAKIIHSMGYETGASVYAQVLPPTLNQDSLRLEAIRTAKQADIVLFIGGLNKSHLQDCEGGDRQQFNLPFGQETLINDILAVNKNLGILLVSGNAIEMPWLPKVNAVLQTWYLGSMAGHAIADVVSGDTNPSGKLPFSFPVKLMDNAAHSFGKTSYPGDSINVVYQEDILVGYRWHDTKKIKPLFAFGHGKSYTTFDIENITSDKKVYSKDDDILINFDLKNTGSVDGAEVVQLYVGMSKSKVKRALKELKGFNKLNLKAGERKSGQISVNVSKLAFYDAAISDWNLEKGTYTFYLGNASDTIMKEWNVKIE